MPDGMNYYKTDVLSVRSLRDWLRQQDGATGYDYWDSDDCVIARYLAAKGTPMAVIEPDRYDFEETAGGLLCAKPWTYAAALSRCNAYLSNTEGRDGEA